MTAREPRTIRVDPDLWAEFEEWVADLEGGKRGAKSEHLENALAEYIDHDRTARVEDVVRENHDLLEEVVATLSRAEEHTHTNSGDHVTAGSETVERTREIADRIHSNYDVSLHEDELERAIKDIAGGDPRTIQKYKDELRERGHAYEHPNQHTPVWCVDRGQWLAQVQDYANQTPDPKGTVKTILDDYPVSPGDVLGTQIKISNE